MKPGANNTKPSETAPSIVPAKIIEHQAAHLFLQTAHFELNERFKITAVRRMMQLYSTSRIIIMPPDGRWQSGRGNALRRLYCRVHAVAEHWYCWCRIEPFCTHSLQKGTELESRALKGACIRTIAKGCDELVKACNKLPDDVLSPALNRLWQRCQLPNGYLGILVVPGSRTKYCFRDREPQGRKWSLALPKRDARYPREDVCIRKSP